MYNNINNIAFDVD